MMGFPIKFITVKADVFSSTKGLARVANPINKTGSKAVIRLIVRLGNSSGKKLLEAMNS